MIMDETLTALKEIGWVRLSRDLRVEDLFPRLGSIVRSTTFGKERKILRPYSKESAPRNSMSMVTGMDAQPMHTDCTYMSPPPKYLILRCLDTGEEKCPTNIWAVNLENISHRYSGVLFDPGWIVRGGGHRAPFYSRILNRDGDREAYIRFDSCCMIPPAGRKSMVEGAVDILVENSKFYEFHWTLHDVIVIDNWRCLHARGNGAEKAPSRRLERTLIGKNNGMVIGASI